MGLRKKGKARMDLRKRKKTRMDLPKRKKRTVESVLEEYEEEVKFLSLLGETDGFDIEHLKDKIPTSLVMYIKNDGSYPNRIRVYAKLGIHKYNFLKGENLRFGHVEKYNERRAPVYCDYYITLAVDASGTGTGSLVPFQTNVVEEGFDRAKLLVGTARLKDDPVEPSTPESSSVAVDDDDSYPRDAKLPQWPSDVDAFQDQSRYYLVRKSELQEYDWIRTYTELAFIRENTRKDIVEEPELSRLAIVKVAVESPKTFERPKDILKAPNATFYIKYKYRHPKVRVGQDQDRVAKPPSLYGLAVVRRTMDEGCFTVMLDTCFLQDMHPMFMPMSDWTGF